MSETVSKIGQDQDKDKAPILSSLSISALRVTRQDIENYRKAVDSARSAMNPRRTLLYDLYYNIILDAHLQAVMAKRSTSITNHKIQWIKDGDQGKPDEFVQKNILECSWFYKMLELIMEARYFGHSLIELVPINGMIGDCVLIPRHNVHPEYTWVSFQYNQPYPGTGNGFNFKQDPRYSKLLVNVGGTIDYGLLLYAAPWVIYKRSGMGDWAQFAEIFGMPFREGRYDPYDDATRKLLEDGLEKMGGAAYAVIPKGAEITFHETSKTGTSELYKDLVSVCDEQVSKVFLGGTMTVENGSSRSQAEVHAKGEDDINLSDMIWVEHILNGVLKDKLIMLGYPLDKGRFSFPETSTIPLKDRITIDMQVSQRVPYSEDYWYKTYSVEKPKEGEALPVPGAPEPDSEEEPDDEEKTIAKKEENKKARPNKGEKKKPEMNACNHNMDYLSHRDTFVAASLSKEDEAFLSALYSDRGEKIKFDYPSFRKNILSLHGGLFKGFGDVNNYNHPDNLVRTKMEENLNRFGFDKSMAEVVELNKVLRATDNFDDFKEKAAGILGNFNGNYLKTEYNLAYASAQNAARWHRQLEEGKDYPYLKYKTTGDDRVRPEHEALDNMIFAVADTSWRNIYPPNGYGCRCEMIQLREDEVDGKVSKMKDAQAALGDEFQKMKDNGFLVNRGDTKMVVDLNKSYASQLEDGDKIDFNKMGWKEAGKKSISDIQKTKKPIEKDVAATPEKILSQFKNNAIIYSDYMGRLIGISKSAAETHLTGKYIEPGELRHQTFHLIKKIIASPDDVFFLKHEGFWQYRFIKIYKDSTMVVIADIVGDKLSIRTWHESKIGDGVRKGMAIK